MIGHAPEPFKVLPWSTARGLLRIGDCIGCRGDLKIRAVKGGLWDWSHVAPVTTDCLTSLTGRVGVTEAIRGGLHQNWLCKQYEKKHGTLFWVPCHLGDGRRYDFLDLIESAQEQMQGYDTWLTLSAAVTDMVMDEDKFNCIEILLYGLISVGGMLPRFDKKNRMLVCSPGDFPLWLQEDSPSQLVTVYQLDMDA